MTIGRILEFTAVAALALGGCSDSRQGSGLDCFPKKAAKWVAGSDENDAFAGRQVRSGPVSIFVDGSGSMLGFLQGQSGSAKPFSDLISTVDDSYREAGDPVSYHLFGSRIRDVTAEQKGQLLQPGSFTCSGDRRSCDNQETRLDLVLERIASLEQGELAIVLTDLWFADPGSQTSGLVPLAPHLENILSDGKTVGIFGLPSPFDGKIYDLPDGSVRAFRGNRPLMVMAVGPMERVQEFSAQFGRSPSAYLADAANRGLLRKAIFSLDPSRPAGESASPLTRGSDPSISQATVLEAIEGVRIQQFSIDKPAALRGTHAPSKAPRWTGPTSVDFVEDAVWEGPLASRSVVWERRGNSCSASDWIEPSYFSEGWSKGENGGEKVFSLDPQAFASTYRRPGVYLVTGEIARTSLNQPNSATQWLREWSMDSAADPKVQGRFFKTLNLSEFARVLENSLAKAAERNPGPIIGFTYVVEVTD